MQAFNLSFLLCLGCGIELDFVYDWFEECISESAYDPCVLEVDRHRDHILSIVAIIVQNFAPCVALVYIISADTVKTQWNKSHIMSKLATFASNYNTNFLCYIKSNRTVSSVAR